VGTCGSWKAAHTDQPSIREIEMVALGGLSQILAGFGLSAASGLNAYIPLLAVAFAAKFTPWLQLSPPFDVLANEWVIATLVVLEFIELFVDKIAGLDHLNDLIQTLIRPAAGAIVFAANAHIISDLHPAVAVILGLVVAFSVHATKASVRPFVTAGTLGMGNWLVSLIEDVIAVIVSVIAIVAPVALVLLLAFFLYWCWRWWRRRAQRAYSSPPPNAALKWPR
jgi:hypothetical protein